MRSWGIFGYLKGDPIPIVLGATRQMCLVKLKAALEATPHRLGDLLPLHYRQFEGNDESGCWKYRRDVAFSEFVTRQPNPSRNGRH